MKKSLFAACVAAGLALSGYLVVGAQGQTPRTAGSPPPIPIGLVDLAEILKNYKKFNVLRDQLRSEFEKKRDVLVEKQNRAKEIQAQKERLKPDSPTFLQAESQLTHEMAELETFRQQARRDLVRQESTLYHDIYGEVQDAVAVVAQQRGLAIVLRHSDKPVSPSDPEDVLRGMNEQVVYHMGGMDITAEVLQLLNARQAAGGNQPVQYAPQQGKGGPQRPDSVRPQGR